MARGLREVQEKDFKDEERMGAMYGVIDRRTIGEKKRKRGEEKRGKGVRDEREGVREEGECVREA